MNDQSSDDTSRSAGAALVPRNPQLALAKAQRAVALTNKLLAPHHDRERRELIDFLVRFNDRDRSTVNILSLFAPISPILIAKYEGLWRWDYLSKNRQLKWSAQLIEQFKKHWYQIYVRYENRVPTGFFRAYKELSANTALPWSMQLIAQYENLWDWTCISRNRSIPWSVDLIDRYAQQLDWAELSANHGLPWSTTLIDRYMDLWSWEKIEYRFDPSYLGLSGNEGIPWSLDLLEKYQDRLDWRSVSCNTGLPWSEPLVAKYADRWDWYALSFNTAVPWTIDLFNKYRDKLTLKWGRYLVHNLKWSATLIDDFNLKVDWREISGRIDIPWSVELVEKYLKHWEWGGRHNEYVQMDDYFAGLSDNPSLPWSEHFIQHFSSHWNWSGLSINANLPWSEHLIERYLDRWDWHELSGNHGLPWSKNLIDRFNKHWAPNLFKNEALYQKAIRPYMDDALVDEVMDRIAQKGKSGSHSTL